MILTCPSCETQYFADEASIGDGGRTVKCAACGHSWFVKPDGAAGDAPSGTRGAHEVYKERVKEQRRRKSRWASLMSWLVTAAIFFALGLASIIFRNDVVKVWPQAASAYKTLGFEVNRFGLEFENIQRARTFNDTIPIVTVTGNAVNVARSKVTTPLVKVELRDEAGKIVADTVTDIRPSTLTAGGSGTFEAIIERAPIESFEIGVSFVDRGDVLPDPPPPAQPVETDSRTEDNGGTEPPAEADDE